MRGDGSASACWGGGGRGLAGRIAQARGIDLQQPPMSDLGLRAVGVGPPSSPQYSCASGGQTTAHIPTGLDRRRGSRVLKFGGGEPPKTGGVWEKGSIDRRHYFCWRRRRPKENFVNGGQPQRCA